MAINGTYQYDVDAQTGHCIRIRTPMHITADAAASLLMRRSLKATASGKDVIVLTGAPLAEVAAVTSPLAVNEIISSSPTLRRRPEELTGVGI